MSCTYTLCMYKDIAGDPNVNMVLVILMNVPTYEHMYICTYVFTSILLEIPMLKCPLCRGGPCVEVAPV